MTLLKYSAILSASTLAGVAFFGAAAYLLLVFGPDLDAARIGF